MAANTCCRSAASASTLMLAPWLAGRARTRLGAIPDLEPLGTVKVCKAVLKNLWALSGARADNGSIFFLEPHHWQTQPTYSRCLQPSFIALQ